MKRILIKLVNNIVIKLLFVIIILFSILGCKESEIVIEHKYKTLNKLPEITKPKTNTINSKILLPHEYICISKSEYIILMNNWTDYRIWAEYNFELIKKRNLLIDKINKENTENEGE